MLLLSVIMYVAALLYFTLDKIIFKGKSEWTIIFLCLYMPFYTLILSIVYSATESTAVMAFFQYLKEIVISLGLISFLLYQKDIFGYAIRLNVVDKLFIAFLSLFTLYLFLPLGEATFFNKLFYFKNTLILGIIYFFGRIADFSKNQLHLLFKCIMAISIAAFVVNVIEAGILHRHLQTYTGYAEYNYAVNNQEVSGNYGLTWTFETQSTSKRLASFFADPLELASSIMLGFAVGLIFYLTSERKDYFLYAVVMLCSTASLFFSSSRAAFAAFFFMLFYIAIVFRLYKLIIAGASLLGSFILYVLFLSSDDFYYFVVDTITFQNASSVGHVIEWLEALDSMIANPMGIGLAMSGNVASVTDELRIGGENQFLIFGVQLGFLGMFLYILLLACAIVISIRVFRLSPDTNAARIAFVAASVKVGMLLPLFTANAELYMYVSWITWWMVGYSVKEYNKIKYASTLLL
ncbi:hypothetical protein EL17_12085 [Anditalea andensis]|uniref:O-antigen ligase-related domain-containing protein n=2 Tax=Anditalea andensis TaxID=1048983 RepID=A0A074LIN7_9BACT|nr:hypothetical protein EL17_12085 [Anditalea andensis]